MPRVVVTHAVEDVQRWLNGKADRAAAIESGSGSNVTDYVAQDGATTSRSLPRSVISLLWERCCPPRPPRQPH